MFLLYELLGRRSFIDPIYIYAVILAWFCPCFLGCFWPILHFLCESSTWQLDSCPPEDTWYGVILWVLTVLGQGLKSECADIFLWLLCHTDKPQNSCLWVQSRSVLSSCGVVLMSCRVNFHVVRYSIVVFCMQNLICRRYYFCWSGLYRFYVLRHIRLRSFAVLCD